MGKYKYLFGPVPSRRLGRSLGIDLSHFKTCSLDCVFCQLGLTTEKTLNRKEYVPTEEVLAELDRWLKTEGNADYITLAGSGEPTLHSRFGEVLDFIRQNSTIPAALLTNGTMLHLPEVREAAATAQVVKISLSAWDQASYEWVNRPHPQLKFDELVKGQKAFREQFRNELWMEVFLMGGINAFPSDVKKIAALAKQIGPDRIQLNTAVRPPAEDSAVPLSRDHLESLTVLFDPFAEVIAEFKTKHTDPIRANQETIFSMLRRRPCTSDQIADTFGMHLNEVSKYLGNLISKNQIRTERKDGEIYYAAKDSGYKGHAQRKSSSKDL